MNLYAATAILFLSSAQAQQIQSPTAALTTFVPTEGSADGEKVVAEADSIYQSQLSMMLEATSPMSYQHNTAQIIEAFGGYGSKSSKTGGHGYGGYDAKSAKKGSGYGGFGYDSKSAKGSGGVTQNRYGLTQNYGAASIESTKGGNGSAKSDKGYGAYDAKSAKKGSGYSNGSGSAKGGKTGGSYDGDSYGDSKSAKGSGYGNGSGSAKGGKTGGSYDGDSYGDSKSAKGSGYGSAKSGKGGYSAVASTVEVEETSAPDVPDVDIDEIVGYLSSLLTGLLDAEGQADAVKPATFDIDDIYDIIGHFLNGYGSKSSNLDD